MSRKKSLDKKMQKLIANGRINKLFILAEENALSGELDLSNRYVELARKISMKNLAPIPKKYKRRFCKHCYSYLLPNVTCRVRIHRVRIHGGKIVVYCYNCRKYTRIPFKKTG
jgi:ribonuclease P protein subunit RPR2